MRKRLTVLVLSTLLLHTGNAEAQIGLGLATETTQILNHAELVLQYLRQAAQLTQAVSQTQDMMKNSVVLPNQIFGPIAADLNQLASIVQNGMALSYSLANLDTAFKSRFPGYGFQGTNYYTAYRNWAQTSLDTAQGALQAAGLQGQQLQSEQGILNSLRGMAQNSDGRMEGLQVMGEMAEQQVQQLMKLRELMLADMSSKQSYQAATIQTQAATEAATQQFFNYVPAFSDGQTFQSGWK